jgi:chaperonin GroEL
MTKLQFTHDNYDKIKEVAGLMNKAVSLTLGVRGKNVLLEDQYGKITCTNDGVTVANSIDVEDKLQRVILNVLKEGSNKTNDIVGDGTTTTMIFATDMIIEALKRIEVDGVHPVDIANGLDVVKEKYNTLLEKYNIPYSDEHEEQLNKVAKVSSRRQDIADIVTKAVLASGKNGLTTIQPNNNNKIELVVNNGYGLENGLVSEHLITDKENRQSQLTKPKVFITTTAITSSMEGILNISKLLGECIENKVTDLLILCTRIDDKALDALIGANNDKIMNIGIVYIPTVGMFQQDIAEDLAVYCGAKLFSSKRGDSVMEAGYKDLGNLNEAILSTKQSILLSLTNSKEVQDQVKALEKHLDEDEDGFTNNQLRQRIAKLTGAISVIKVGGNNEIELNATKFLVEDAVNAVRSSFNFGYVNGGGTTFYNIAKELVQDEELNRCNVARFIFNHALNQPLITLVDNANVKPIESIYGAIDKNPKAGYNFETNQLVEDIGVDGILDPWLVAKLSMENAVSIAKMVLTTGAINYEDNIRMNKSR